MNCAGGRTIAGRTVRCGLVSILPLAFVLLLVADQPETAGSLSRTGAGYLQQGELDKALAAFQKAARLQPSDPALQFNIGLTLYQMGRGQEALEPLGKAAAHPPSAPRARFLRGTIFFQAGRFEACAREVETLRADKEYGDQVLFMLIESNRRLGRTQQAQEAFEDLNRRSPDSAYMHRLMGMAYDAQADYPKAIEEFKAALRVRHDMPEVAFAIGYIYWKQQDYENARTWLLQELAGQACYARAHFYLGEVDRAEQKWNEAAAHYRRALQCDPDLFDSYLGLGIASERAGKWDEALKIYLEVVKRRPDNAQGHYKLGAALQHFGRDREAQQEFAKARELMAAEQEKARERVRPSKPPDKP